ncbi:MAG: hypothetical protein HYX68_20430 [Planctomycetes bacterium]|nr:hypothetical protein [Planctomycetota bacterium]
MIEFDCPKCGEPMEVKEHKAGERVRCVECDRLVRVPDRYNDRPIPRGRAPRDQGLTGNEWLLYGLLCLFVPGVNVIFTSVLYYTWQRDQPTRAGQINMLGFGVFGIHVAAVAFIVCLGVVLSGQ